ncbi:MAG TPA: hypothetical protein ENH70_07595, partial [Desulfobacteraceae bacterium]|nr:hypothetical protein [Desulfobacteraceae bacterium]
MCTWSAVGYAQEPVVTVVPFKIYASPKLKNLSKGLQNMFVLRMQKKGIKVTPTRTTNTYPLSSSSVTRDTAVQLAKAFNSSFVVDGSLTQMGKKLSVDVRLFDVKSGKEPFFFYGVA